MTIKSNQAPGDSDSPVEHIKWNSKYLRGSMVEGLADRVTGAISEDDTQLTKFHGIYQQDDRDLRVERMRQKLEPLHSFMVRVRVPGGVCTPEQYLEMDRIAQEHANGTLKLTTRQAFQFHGILKRNLKESIAEINRSLLDTLAACGDVNRNVMCNTTPELSGLHAAVYEAAARISEHLTPGTRAYHEIWLNGEKVAGGEDPEPLYGQRYLPRKFKIGVAVPPSNDVDVYSQDLGLVAVANESGELEGFNILVGGGMGMTHSEPDTFPAVGQGMGFCRPDQAVAVAEQVVSVQRDFGDRTNRKHARLKYTLDDRGLDWFRSEVETRLGWKLEEARPFAFTSNGDRYGWVEGENGNQHLTLYIPNGRICDTPERPQMCGLRELAKVHQGDFRLTPNQHLVIANVAPDQKAVIEALVAEYKLFDPATLSGLRLGSMACVALPTCGLAMAESERYLPTLIDRIDELLLKLGLENEPMTIRMTGCPNGCARPYLAEIALVGKAPGKYNLFLGGGFVGDRLNRMYRENIGEDEILDVLTPLFEGYAQDRQSGEHFGDYLIRSEVLSAVTHGREVHG